MAISHRRRTFSAEEYLKLERLAETRSEFYAGEIFALAGASREHNTLINCAAELRAQLKGRPCNIYASDFRTEVQAEHRYTYPDVVVTCGDEQFSDSERDTLQNPALFPEGLSSSTAANDRGDKFASCRTLPSLQTYVLVSRHKCHVERFEQQEDESWRFSASKALSDTVTLERIGCTLLLREVYDKVLADTQP